MSGPAWNCFRADFRRRWRARNIAHAMGILLLIGGLQLVISLVEQRFWSTPRWLGLKALMAAFSLYSPLIQPFAGGFGSASPQFHPYLALQAILALPGLACRFLMPAAAASSIAPDREKRRIAELILAGLTSRQILVAKGLAAVLPFLAVAAATLIASCATWQLAPVTDPWILSMGFSLEFLILCGGVVSTTGLLVSSAIQVCISALSGRTSTAMVGCYSFECLLVPVFYLVSEYGWLRALSPSMGMGRWGITACLYLAPLLTVVFLQAVPLCFLWPRALRALAHQD